MPSCCELPFGSNLCHCGACHQTFSGLTLFDSHQAVAYEPPSGVSCKEPEAMGLVRDTSGTWRTPEAAKSLLARMEKLRAGRDAKNNMKRTA